MIATPDRRVRVFVSSTLDLTDERAVMKRSVESLGLTPVMFEAGARPHPPRALYQAYLEQSDVFVAIYARRYGWTAPDLDVSGLEDEFNLSAGKPRLVYIQAGVEREPALDVFLDRVKSEGLSYKPYRVLDELEALVKGDLVVLLSERFYAGAPQPAAGRSPERRRAPLPVPPSLFVGRDDDVRIVGDALGHEDVRLVTLVGPGGIGKTRLAIAAAQAAGGDFEGGTFFVPLAPVREPALVADTITSHLGVSTCDACPAAASIADFFGERRALLVLDNFEHLLDAAPVVAELLGASAGLTVLVTSRAPLRVRGEHEIPVAPLDVPPENGDTATFSGSAAVELFVAAARATRPDFVLDDTNTATVGEICRELDGLPLAIELAAAMMRLLTPAMLLDRLRRSDIDLRGVLRDVPDRHQGLRATIAWSYELLDEPTRKLFEQLGVFRGGFTVEDVETVCSVDGDALDLLARLVEQSLLRADLVTSDSARFSMLSTVRRFADERLEKSQARDVVVARHAQRFIGLLDRVGAPGGRYAKRSTGSRPTSTTCGPRSGGFLTPATRTPLRPPLAIRGGSGGSAATSTRGSFGRTAPSVATSQMSPGHARSQRGPCLPSGPANTTSPCLHSSKRREQRAAAETPSALPTPTSAPGS